MLLFSSILVRRPRAPIKIHWHQRNIRFVAVAKSAGLTLMIGGNVESILAMTGSACFAAGQGGFDFADLDTPLFMAENPFDGGFALDGGKLSVAHIAAGHGVTPKR